MQKLIDAIYKTHEDREALSKPRTYMGGSMIGKECDREVWLAFRHAILPTFDGRMLRLFQRGHREEPAFVEELIEIGIEVHQLKADGSQFGVEAIEGHAKGHLDGVLLNVPDFEEIPHLFEAKTESKKRWQALSKNGVVKEHPVHFVQMQFYMGLMELPAAIYLSVCKDDDRIHCERIEFDPGAFAAIMERARNLVYLKDAPERITEDPTRFVCKFCDFRPLCHGKTFPLAGCRTCVAATPNKQGGWTCDKHEKDLSLDDQLTGCDDHLFLPNLVPGEAIATTVDPSSITYDIDGVQVVNSATAWKSKELEGLSSGSVLETVAKVKGIFGGQVISEEEATS